MRISQRRHKSLKTHSPQRHMDASKVDTQRLASNVTSIFLLPVPETIAVMQERLRDGVIFGAIEATCVLSST